MDLGIAGRLAVVLGQPGAHWQQIGTAPGMVTLAALDGRLFGATEEGGLWVRPPLEPAP